LDTPAIIASADKAMGKRGFARVVGVSMDSQLVAVYLPRQTTAPEKVRCFVLVIHEQDVVIAGARGNLSPLMELLDDKIRHNEHRFAPLVAWH
jgi:hypothetical protein